MVSIASRRVEKRKGMHEETSITEMHPKWLHLKKGLMGGGCNQTRSSPQRAPKWQSLELERLTQAESIEASEYRHANRNDPNPF